MLGSLVDRQDFPQMDLQVLQVLQVLQEDPPVDRVALYKLN